MKLWRYMIRRNRIGLLGLGLVVFFAIVALLPGLFAPYDPAEMHPTAALSPPSAQFPFGTDRYGRDVLSRVVYGTRISFQVGILSVLVAALVGSVLGLAGGFFEGSSDYVIMRAMDTIFAFPALLLAIALAAVAGAGLTSVVIAIGIVYTPIFARVARAPTLAVKKQEFVSAAIAVGVKTPRLLGRHIVPNVLTPITVQMALSLSAAIIVEAALSYLGLGAVPPTPSLGSMLSEARPFMELAPWTVVYPGLALAGIILGINLFGDALRDVLDPRQRTEL